jgi:hypothetical protein
MRTVLDERFAPITSSVGFLELPLEQAAQGLGQWRESLYDHVHVERLATRFPETLHQLEPLTGGARPRELLTSNGRWTAYFDNSLRGTDAVSAIGYLSRTLKCQGLAITAVPHTIGASGIRLGRAGAVHFELFGPLTTGFLNYVRTVAVTYDGSRWVFNATGTPQAFEEVDAYRARRVRDRFTTDMLDRYCAALGIDLFGEKSYGPESVLIESSAPVPPDGAVMSLTEAQAWLEIAPGEARGLPG